MNSTIKPSKCRECGSPYHSAMYHKPKKPFSTHHENGFPQRAKAIFCTNCDTIGHVRMQCHKRIHKSYQHGTYYRKWLRTREKWVKDNPQDFYTCHYCDRHLDQTTLTLDHKIPRSRAPELRYEYSNLVVCCAPCNRTKGSVDHDSYKHDCPDNVKETV